MGEEEGEGKGVGESRRGSGKGEIGWGRKRRRTVKRVKERGNEEVRRRDVEKEVSTGK